MALLAGGSRPASARARLVLAVLAAVLVAVASTTARPAFADGPDEAAPVPATALRAGFEAAPSEGLPPAAVGAPPTADIRVTYHGFSKQAQDAFEYAVSLWESYLVAKVPIFIDATWTAMDKGLLGSTSSLRNIKDDTVDKNLPAGNVQYPSSLANQFRGARLDNSPDITMRLNSTASWYFGTDGEGGAKPDLVDTALHEIAHGLGIDSTSRADANGFRFGGGYPTIFESFIVTGTGARLTDLPKSNPLAFAAALTGRDLYFTGPAAQTAVGSGFRGVKLYVPPEWEPGSSVAHVDEWLFQPPSMNSLMAPAAWGGWTVHDPGPFTLAMLQDIGWQIAGTGKPARLSVGLLPPSVRGPKFTLSVPVVVTVTDTVGAPMTSDNSTRVSLELWGPANVNLRWDCTAESSPTKTVTRGVASFGGCGVHTAARFFFKATASGLAVGNSNRVYAAAKQLFASAISDDR